MSATERPATWDDAVAAERRQLQKHGLKDGQQPLGLALSGGGIRAATFSLGLLQGLAKEGLLAKFHYLSTVSGGGYIGSWLSALIKRRAGGKVLDVQDILAPKSGEPPEDSAIQFLRRYSNYLTPQVGIMSADTWTAIVTYSRNLMINVTVLLCVVLTLIFGAHLCIAWGAGYLRHEIFRVAGSPPLALWAGATALFVAALFIGLNLNKERAADKPASQTAVLWGVVVPSFIAATCWAFFFGANALTNAAFLGFANIVAFCAIINGLLWIISAISYWLANRRGTDGVNVSPRGFRGSVALFIGSVIGGAVAGAVVYGYVYLMQPDGPLGAYISSATMDKWFSEVRGADSAEFPEYARTYLASAFHLAIGTLAILVALATGIMTQIGLVKRHLLESEREWLARLGGWLYVGSILWCAIFAIVALGPGLVIWISANFPILAKSGAILWIAQTVGALILGKSALTGGREPKRPWLEKLLSFAPYVFIFGVLFIVAYGVDRVLIEVNNKKFNDTIDTYCKVAEPSPVAVTKTFVASNGVDTLVRVTEPPPHSDTVMTKCDKLNKTIALPLAGVAPAGELVGAPWSRVGMEGRDWFAFAFFVGLTLLSAFLTFVVSWRVDINLFSFQQFYRNRLARCYLGASRFRAVWKRALDEKTDKGKSPKPDRDDRQANQFTDLSDDDDLYLATLRDQRPFHIINTALNMTAPGELGWQERKAASFTMTPLHCGFSLPGAEHLRSSDESCAAGYRATEAYASGDAAIETQTFKSGVALGMAMSTSGAAASSSMGHNSTAALALLLTVFNVRLGRWSGNPAYCTEAGRFAKFMLPAVRRERLGKPWQERSPWLGLNYLISELFGNIDNQSKFVYLSDGGHFENLGVYELVRRRALVIVVSSCGRDSDYVFDDLSNAIRLCYTDFGININIDPQAIKPDEHGISRSQFAVGRIRYSAVDPSLKDGYLIYIKPAITARTSVDILQYRSVNPDFPQQSTAGQWYTESQFESHRKLGYETAREVIRDVFANGSNVRAALDSHAAK